MRDGKGSKSICGMIAEPPGDVGSQASAFPTPSVLRLHGDENGVLPWEGRKVDLYTHHSSPTRMGPKISICLREKN